jgi:hypothetical protein
MSWGLCVLCNVFFLEFELRDVVVLRIDDYMGERKEYVRTGIGSIEGQLRRSVC